MGAIHLGASRGHLGPSWAAKGASKATWRIQAAVLGKMAPAWGPRRSCAGTILEAPETVSGASEAVLVFCVGWNKRKAGMDFSSCSHATLGSHLRCRRGHLRPYWTTDVSWKPSWATLNTYLGDRLGPSWRPWSWSGAVLEAPGPSEGRQGQSGKQFLLEQGNSEDHWKLVCSRLPWPVERLLGATFGHLGESGTPRRAS